MEKPSDSALTEREEIVIDHALKLMQLAESWMQSSSWYQVFPTRLAQLDKAAQLMERAERILLEHNILENDIKATGRDW